MTAKAYYLIFTYFAFTLTQVTTSSSDSRIEPEVLTTLEVRPCFTDKSKQMLHPNDSLGSLFVIDHGDFCVQGRTDKHIDDYPSIKMKNVANSNASVFFNWTTLGVCSDCKPAFCSIKYHGYKHLYRLSPDFGDYKGCNRELTRYFGQVHESLQRAVADSSMFLLNYRFDCPIDWLPLKFESYSMCRIKLNYWYLLEFNSLFELEFKNKSISRVHNQSYWAFPTYPNRNQEKIFILKTRPLSCALKILFTLTWDDLPFEVIVETKLSYSALNNNTKKANVLTESQAVVLDVENSWREFVYNFSTTFLTYSVELCYRGLARVELGSTNVTAFVSNNTRWFCSANRVDCSPPIQTPVSGTNVNCLSFKLALTLFSAVFFIYDVLFMSCSL